MSLEEYVEAVTAIVESGQDVAKVVRAIAPLKRRLIENHALTPDSFHDGLETLPYTRNLLYADPQGRFTVMAVAWGAGRETPVHDHQSWGVVGVVRESIDVEDYVQEADGRLAPCPSITLATGEVVEIQPPRQHNIHKMMNRSAVTAMTIHTYGDPARLCHVYDPKTGRCTARTLSFNHSIEGSETSS